MRDPIRGPRPGKYYPWRFAAQAWGWIALALIVAVDARAGRPAFRTDPDYIIDYWETEDGLPENSATAMVQTADGYLWFGTFNGLVRFDGLKFTVLDPSNTPALPSPGVVNLHLDRSGRLWVSTLRGLVVRQGQEWRAIEPPGGWTDGCYVRTFAERGNGDLLFTTFDGGVLEFAAGRLRVLPPPPGEAGKGYFGVADGAGQWWVVQHRFIGRWDGARWVSEAQPGEMGANQVGAAPARDGGLWVLTGRQLRKYHEGREVARIDLPELLAGVWSVFEDGGGNVWVCTADRGVYRVRPDGGLRHWSSANGLAYDGTRFVFEDRERNLWVGTSGGGLMRFRPREFLSLAGESGLTERVVNSVTADAEGSVWIGTYGKGLFRLSGGRITPVPLSDAAGGVTYVQSVLADRAGRVWVGTFGQGLWRIERDGAARVGGAGLQRENVLSFFEDSAGRLWIGGGQELWVYEAGEFRVRHAGDGRPVRAVCGLAEDPAGGGLWMTNRESVFRLREGRIDAVTSPDGRAIADVSCLKVDAGGTVWMGTTNKGLLRWRDGRLSGVDAAGGFPSRAVHAIEEDDQGYFWMTSGQGVVRAHRRDLDAAVDSGGGAGPLAYRVFDLADGLPSVEGASGRQPVVSRDRSGRLWLATPKGLAAVDPARIRSSPPAPPTRVEAVVYEPGSDPTPGGSKWERRNRVEPPVGGRVILPPGSRHVDFVYTGLGLAAPDKVRFQVRVEGRDDNWREVGHDRVAHYHDPPPGDYVFRVRAATADGRWDGAGASLAFSVRPFVWQTVWFRVALATVLAALVVWVVQARHRRLRGVARRERDRSAALVALAHSPSAARGDLGRAFAEATEVAAAALGVRTVGIWLLDDGGRELRCADLFDATDGTHREEDPLRVSDFPRYFESLQAGRVVDSADEAWDLRSVELPRTREENRGRKTASVHAAVRASGELVGVVRYERSGAPRAWRTDEVAFAGAVADQVAQALSSARRARAARELRGSEERLRSVVETCPIGMVVADAGDRITMVNAEAERTFGYPRHELVGRSIHVLFAEPLPGRSAKAARPAGANGPGRATPRGHELRGRRADGLDVPVEVRTSAMGTGTGQCQLFAVTDLSERKRVESQADQLHNEVAHLSRVVMLGELSGSLAHELNQPLTSILINAQAAQHFLGRGDTDVRELEEILRDIVADDKRAGEVIRRLHDMFTKGDIQHQPLDLNNVLQEVLKLARSDLIDCGIAVDVRVAPGLPPIVGDRVQLQQVLLNLIKNACDAMDGLPPGDRKLGVLSARSPDGSGVLVSIRDQGCGVPPDGIGRIFEPFFSTKATGMGLGLAVCRNIVERHGGVLRLENNTDRGATALLQLPTPAAARPATDTTGAASASHATPRWDQSPIARAQVSGLHTT